MSQMANLRKHYKRSDAEKGSRFNSPAIPFISKATSLKLDNAQEFNLRVSLTRKQSTYKFKAHAFSNGMVEDVLEWGKWLVIVIKNKPIETAKNKFDLVEAILKGNALTHWQ
eukprot:2154578-Ditylum_brightwellii.AAC.1